MRYEASREGAGECGRPAILTEWRAVERESGLDSGALQGLLERGRVLGVAVADEPAGCAKEAVDRIGDVARDLGQECSVGGRGDPGELDCESGQTSGGSSPPRSLASRGGALWAVGVPSLPAAAGGGSVARRCKKKFNAGRWIAPVSAWSLCKDSQLPYSEHRHLDEISSLLRRCSHRPRSHGYVSVARIPRSARISARGGSMGPSGVGIAGMVLIICSTRRLPWAVLQAWRGVRFSSIGIGSSVQRL